ncbi:DUF4129 domain-containing protein [Gramella lutea]|uniref:DUF4129 domain-containing protein n=1 Tax=Christiangramia lutea TaxID=1607951 RepID=A0A9X1V1U7_9FLAO|nr:DUF4129 domain-containing protein [Christiangramia lutea]MCH4822827.1 DUF4129 domain-containing protein [Christiangramia lutea]
MKKFILILLTCFFFGNVFPQEKDSIIEKKEISYDQSSGLSPIEFDQEKIEAYKTQKEFDYLQNTENESWWTRFKKWLNAKYQQFMNWLFGDYEPNSVLALIISIVPFILLLVLLGLVAWLFSRLNPGGRMLQQPKTSDVFLTEEEELVKKEDLPKLIKKAVNNGEFRLAVRYYYLDELRKLDELRLIDYKFQKTNKDYSEEIEDYVIGKHFYEISKLYEFIWYGSFQVSEADYRKIEKNFQSMDNSLNSFGHE